MTTQRPPPDEWPENEVAGPAHEYPSGVTLFHQGVPVRTLYLVEEGFVKLTRSEAGGRDTVIAVRSHGWLLAAAAGLLNRPHPVTAETVTACVIRQLLVADYLRLVQSDIEVSNWLHRMQARQSYEQIVLLGQFGSLSPRQRLERFLARAIADRLPQAGATPLRIQLPIKQHELAQAIGITPEHVSRLFAQLEADGTLRREKGWLVIPETSTLLRRIGELAPLYE